MEEIETPEPTIYPTMLDLIQKSDAPVEDSIIVAWSSRETAEPDAPGDLTSTAPSETTRAVEVTEHRGGKLAWHKRFTAKLPRGPIANRTP